MDGLVVPSEVTNAEYLLGLHFGVPHYLKSRASSRSSRLVANQYRDN